MSLIFGKCRLAFFVAFKAKRAIFMAFWVFFWFLLNFQWKWSIFIQKIALRGIILQTVNANCRFYCNYLEGNFIFKVIFRAKFLFQSLVWTMAFWRAPCRLEMAFWKKSSGHTDLETGWTSSREEPERSGSCRKPKLLVPSRLYEVTRECREFQNKIFIAKAVLWISSCGGCRVTKWDT